MNRQAKSRTAAVSVIALLGAIVAIIGIIQESSGAIGAGVVILAASTLPMWIWRKREPI